MALALLAIVLLTVILAVSGRLGLSMADLLEPEEDEREWLASPGDAALDFTEALRPYGSARRGE